MEEAGEEVWAEGDLLSIEGGSAGVGWVEAAGDVAGVDEVLGGDLVGGAPDFGGVGDVSAVGQPGFVGLGGGVADGDGLHAGDRMGRVGFRQVFLVFGGFALSSGRVPVGVLCDPGLSHGEKVLFCYLWWSLQGGEGHVPPLRRLGGRLRMATTTVRTGFRRLDAAGWLEYRPGRGGKRSYVVLHSSPRLV